MPHYDPHSVPPIKASLLLALLLAVLVPGAAMPHGGGLDAYGCHHDRKQGGYHCHRGEFAGQFFASQAEMLAARQPHDPAVQPSLPSIQFSGKVVGITEGYTVKVLHNGKAEKIRLHGIDSPEKGQPFGTKAKQFTSEMVFGKTVTVHVTDMDRYGRTVGDVILTDGRILNRELVAAGLAWWYRQYSRDASLGQLEAEARAARKGLWADPNPVPPWCWRKQKKGREC